MAHLFHRSLSVVAASKEVRGSKRCASSNVLTSWHRTWKVRGRRQSRIWHQDFTDSSDGGKPPAVAAAKVWCDQSVFRYGLRPVIVRTLSFVSICRGEEFACTWLEGLVETLVVQVRALARLV